MKAKALIVVVACCGAVLSTQAKDPPTYMKGVLLEMESTPCGMAEKGSKTIAGEILGTDGEHKMTQQVLCQEYVLQTERTVYRIRPKDDKHPALLPIGETAEFRIDKERDYVVVSMTQRAESTQAKAERKAGN
jgi:hypothetical protein